MILAISICLALIWPASAEVFQCEHQTSAPIPALVCSDQQTTDTSYAGWVSLRKMPGWGTHAGLTIIDFCLRPLDSGKVEDASLVVYDSASVNQKYLRIGDCKRRYCTDKKKAFAFFLNGLPFPLGWSVVSFRLGIQTQSFAISCDEFGEVVDGVKPGGQR